MRPGLRGTLKIDWKSMMTNLDGVFAAGDVASAFHPRYGRNHGTAEPFATSTRLQASDRTVLHDAEHPSAVWLPVHG